MVIIIIIVVVELNISETKQPGIYWAEIIKEYLLDLLRIKKNVSPVKTVPDDILPIIIIINYYAITNFLSKTKPMIHFQLEVGAALLLHL